MSHIPSFLSSLKIFLIMNLEYLVDFGKWFDNILPKWRLNLTSTFFLSPGKGFTVGSIPQIVAMLPGNWFKSFHNGTWSTMDGMRMGAIGLWITDEQIPFWIFPVRV